MNLDFDGDEDNLLVLNNPAGAARIDPIYWQFLVSDIQVNPECIQDNISID